MESLFEVLSSPPLRAKGSFGCPLGLIRPPGQIVQTYAAKIGNTCKNCHLRLSFTILEILISSGGYTNLFGESSLRYPHIFTELNQSFRKNRHFSYTLLTTSYPTCII